jgi:hypothetical protein
MHLKSKAVRDGGHIRERLDRMKDVQEERKAGTKER